jgi:copper transport protein
MVRAWGGRGILAATLVALVALALPAAAAAHAELEGSSPSRGKHLQRAPERVELHFSEPVEVSFGAVRVYNAGGERVDTGPTSHPGGRADLVGVKLRNGLRDGVYTATYRIISADSHPVAGGYTFTVGAGGAAPAASVDDLIDAGGAGPVTEGAFGAVRALAYLAIALAVGGFAFAAAVWRPALRGIAGAAAAWRGAGEAFAARARTVGLAAAALGVATSALGIVLQGATADATSFWSALDPSLVGDVLDTRFGTVWGLRLLAWLAVGALLLLPAARLRTAELRPASLGATGFAVSPAARPLGVGVATALLAFLCLTPALAGHASNLDPSWLLVPANVLHVVAMAVWVGGIGMLVLALLPATRRLEQPDRTRLLAAAVTRFSDIALFAVAALVASGVTQAIPELESFSDFVDTAFGRALLAKIVLLVGLIGLGAWNRGRARPRLAVLAMAGAPPGRTGLELRRSLRAEATLMAAVLGVTAALVAYAPPVGGAGSDAGGPFSASKDLGPARMEVTVDPARAGANEVHVYLLNRRDGRQYDRAKELDVRASLPERSVGPVQLQTEKAGPGHYVVRRAQLAPGGDWTLEVSARVSEFDLIEQRVAVPID